MILDLVIGMISVVLGLFLDLLPAIIPQFPAEVDAAVNQFYGMISGAVGMINLLFPLKIAIPLLVVVVIVEQFDNLKRIIFWILRKIPFLGIQ